MAVAKRRRCDDQVATGWKKPAKTLPIAASWGTKRSVLIDGRGVPLGVEVSGANIHDIRLLQGTLNSKPIRREIPTNRKRQHLCLDKGDDSDDARRYLRERNYVPHIKSRGEEARDLKTKSGYRARRWVVECTHSWIDRFHRLLIRWKRRPTTTLPSCTSPRMNHTQLRRGSWISC